MAISNVWGSQPAGSGLTTCSAPGCPLCPPPPTPSPWPVGLSSTFTLVDGGAVFRSETVESPIDPWVPLSEWQLHSGNSTVFYSYPNPSVCPWPRVQMSRANGWLNPFYAFIEWGGAYVGVRLGVGVWLYGSGGWQQYDGRTWTGSLAPGQFEELFWLVLPPNSVITAFMETRLEIWPSPEYPLGAVKSPWTAKPMTARVDPLPPGPPPP